MPRVVVWPARLDTAIQRSFLRGRNCFVGALLGKDPTRAFGHDIRFELPRLGFDSFSNRDVAVRMRNMARMRRLVPMRSCIFAENRRVVGDDRLLTNHGLSLLWVYSFALIGISLVSSSSNCEATCHSKIPTCENVRLVRSSVVAVESTRGTRL